MFVRSIVATGFVAAVLTAVSASAAVFTVGAASNSSSGGTGKATISVVSGNTLKVTAGVNDLWSAGALPRWSNADGLTGDRFATGSDESGEAAGTLIGVDFGTWTQNGLAAPYGTLVGEIGGVFRALGTSFAGPAWNTGTLNLYYWDSNFADNSGSIDANVSVVPEPESWVMLIAGFGLVGAAARRRVRQDVAA